MCERLFWRAWQFQGSIQVGAIRNGGIGYVVSYLDKQLHGYEAWLKYDYNHLQRPFQTHSLGLGEGLYKSQLKYIHNHEGNYRWHGKDRPVPAYYKNKFLITSDKTIAAMRKKYTRQVSDILNKYGVKIHNYKDLEKFKLDKAQVLQKQREISLVQKGKPIRIDSKIAKECNDIINDRHRIPTLFDKNHLKIIDNRGKWKYKIDSRKLITPDKMTTRQFMKLGTSFNQMYSKFKNQYGFSLAEKVFYPSDSIPF